MSFRRNQKGFIFSLDATLATLVVLIVIAGVARVAGPELIYGQHGYLRLERYANDALEVLELTGMMDSIVNYVKHGYLENAEVIAENELRKILPRDVQFRLVIGDVNNPRLDNVYPSAGNDAEWYAAFQNAGEVVSAVRVSTLAPSKRIKMLAWVDDNDENFMALLTTCTNIDNKSVNNVTTFWNEIDTALVNWTPGNPYYDVVFIPDAEIDLAPGDLWAKITDLVVYQKRDGRLVVGGKTLYYNSQFQNADGYLWESLGVQWIAPPQATSGPPLDNMRIINRENFVTLPYDNGDNIEYNENYTQYVYTPIDNSWVVAQWEDTPGGVPSPLRGIIVRPAGYNHSWQGTLPKPAVLFNMRFAQSATDPNNPMGTADWITLAKRAIGYEEVLEPITLYVWRGSAVG
ncbi:MAG: hypothetical protein QMD00_03025 [Hadesarchaea archaeon]|nr:hypothetical protein [Hadesarchaea archaeon]